MARERRPQRGTLGDPLSPDYQWYVWPVSDNREPIRFVRPGTTSQGRLRVFSKRLQACCQLGAPGVVVVRKGGTEDAVILRICFTGSRNIAERIVIRVCAARNEGNAKSNDQKQEHHTDPRGPCGQPTIRP